MKQCAILMFADDLSGASDSGAEFFRRGLCTEIVLQSNDRQKLDSTCNDALVLDTDSRTADKEEAIARLRKAIELTSNVDANVCYKKIDSTLRGNVALELECLMNGRNFDVCFFAPALPEAGRITVGRYHLLNGVPVSLCNIDVKSSSVLELLGCQSGWKIEHIPLEKVMQGMESVLDHVTKSLDEKRKTVYACDATSQEQLYTIAQTAAKMQENSTSVLLCGSAGLAREVPRAFSLRSSTLQKQPSSQNAPARSASSNSILIVQGSHHSVTERQIGHLLKTERSVLSVELDPVKGLVNVPDSTQKPAVILLSLKVKTREEALDTLVQAATTVFDACQPSGLIVTGGTTAASLLLSLSVDLLRFEEYIEPYAALCRVTGGELDSFPVVIKPGGLCSESVFSTSVSVLRDRQLSSKPVIALTMGDPCGIGPEIIVKALALPRVSHWCRILVLGDPDSLKKATTFCGGLSEITIVVAETYEQDGKKWPRLNWPENKSSVLVWNPLQVKSETTFTLGEVMPEAGRFAAEWVIFSVQLAISGVVDAIVTAPLNKEAMNLGGYKFAGHTELLAKYSDAKTSRLMLASGNFKVVHATGHCSYKDVPAKLTKERIIETIELARDFFVASDVADPKIAVAGLNPHAGDGGLFGDEEPRVIEPAVAECRARGWNVTGPFPADTLFGKVVRGDYDLVVAMYHDQGHIPAKLIGFEDTVNVTLGLPIIRTSVDHGTAFDIAGRGIANCENLLKALRLGSDMARKRLK